VPTVDTGYRPRALQAELHRRVKRFNVVVTHRRFGKTVFGLNECIDRALTCQLERPRYAYIAPFRSQAKSIAWDYLKAYTAPIPGVEHNEAELRADIFRGARIQLFGADNPQALRGMYWDGVILDEYAQISPQVWSEIVRPALSDRNGWAIFTGTPMGRNHFAKVLQDAQGDPLWYTVVHKASQTGIIAPEELEAAHRAMGDDRYEQEYECSFDAAIQGTYYSEIIRRLEKEGQITGVSYEPKLETFTAWDLGIDDSTAIWWMQNVGREVRIIDYYEGSGVGLDHYVKVIRDKPYVYGGHFLPHDAEVRELGTGQSRMETLASLGLRNVTVVKRQSVEDGIQAVRNYLPRCWIDATKCARGIEALKQYRKEWDDKTQTFRQRPLHDWTSHASDAFRYLSLAKPTTIKWDKIKYPASGIV